MTPPSGLLPGTAGQKLIPGLIRPGRHRAGRGDHRRPARRSLRARRRHRRGAQRARPRPSC